MNKILNKIIKLAEKDTQIDTSGVFNNFTDFQNTMFSEFCLLELLWTGDEKEAKNKTIGELFLENFNNVEDINYDNLIFDGYDWFKMSNKENWKEYRNLVLGKFIRYGFSNIKINKMINGKDGFDAFILEDVNKNIMVYYPCTNLIELDDYIYDGYNAISIVSKKQKFLGKITTATKKYNSQQNQAKDILIKCIKKVSKRKKVNVFGFSLGGGLAEASYLNSLDKYNSVLGNIILFNPYHDRLTPDHANKLKDCGKLKIYACEGDIASTIFNYDDFKDITKPIYIGSSNKYENSLNSIKDSNLTNPVTNYLKNDYCDSLIMYLKKLKQKCLSFDFISKKVLDISIKQIEYIKNIELNSVDIIDRLGKILSILKKHGFRLTKKYNLNLLNNMRYFEYIFTSPHLPYGVEINKKISFDENGKILKLVNTDEGIYEVKYPSVSNELDNIFGVNI